jgi:hypothetical protein
MQSTLEQVLQSIKPGLTLYGVLVTFAVFALSIARHFWRYEKELDSENVERLRDLMRGFRLQHIEPEIVKVLATRIDDAYELAIGGLIDELHQRGLTDKGGFRRELVSDQEIKSIIAESALNERLEGLKKRRDAEKFMPSESGQKLLDELDHLYEQKSALVQHYHLAERACRRTCYASLCVFSLSLFGILRVLGRWPDVVLFFWLFLSLQAIAYGGYSFIDLERHRRALSRMWKEMQFYGKI